MKKWRMFLFSLVAVVVMTGVAVAKERKAPPPVPEIHPGLLMGYLPVDKIPDSAVLVPPPPAAGSAAQALDEEISRRSMALRGTPRWKLAVADAELKFPKAAKAFSCALGLPITQKNTPYLYMMLRRTLTDVGLSTYSAKLEYNRPRPFMVNKAPICTPDEQSKLAEDGSYPSGHTAIGWAWALILTEVAPGKAEAILARGRSFGESRTVCNVHWSSDVIQGRFMGAAMVARLHAEPAFHADLEAAKAEIAVLRARGLKPEGDCRLEAEALSFQP